MPASFFPVYLATRLIGVPPPVHPHQFCSTAKVKGCPHQSLGHCWAFVWSTSCQSQEREWCQGPWCLCHVWEPLPMTPLSQTVRLWFWTQAHIQHFYHLMQEVAFLKCIAWFCPSWRLHASNVGWSLTTRMLYTQQSATRTVPFSASMRAAFWFGLSRILAIQKLLKEWRNLSGNARLRI